MRRHAPCSLLAIASPLAACGGGTPPVESRPVPPTARAPTTAPAAPPVRRTSGIVWAGIALASLLVAAGITLGVLYYLGWLDPDPPPRPRKPVPTKPAPTSTHRPSTTR